jgi:predicted secreted protein
MDWFTGVIVYLLIWWTALFCVLPIGTRPVEDADPEAGGWRGAPTRPLLLQKVVGTTVLSAILWLGAHALITSEWISFRDGWWAYQGPGISSPLPGRAQN